MSPMAKRVVVDVQMQQGDVYGRTDPVGRKCDVAFTPELAPKQMRALGVCGGTDVTDC